MPPVLRPPGRHRNASRAPSRTAVVSAARIGESSFHRCQYSGTSIGRDGSSSTSPWSSPVCRLRQQSPAQSVADGVGERRRPGNEVPRRLQSAPCDSAQEPGLQFVLAVEVEHRCHGEGVRGRAVGEPAFGEVAAARARGSASTPAARRCSPAPPPGRTSTAAITVPSRSRVGRVGSRLPDADRTAPDAPAPRPGEGRNHPRGQRIRVDDDATDGSSSPPRGRGTTSPRARGAAIWRASVQHDVTGLGGPDRLGPLHQDAAPTCCSSALIRWLTADGVTCSRRAAASKLPSSTTAANVRSWCRGRGPS